MNGNSAYNWSNSNSFKANGDGRDLPLVQRMAMGIPPMLVSGI